MRPGAVLSVQTFVTANTGGKGFVQKRYKRSFHAFEVVELKQFLIKAGFEEFRSELEGTSITFSVHKALPKA
jgi:hypothetical protein